MFYILYNLLLCIYTTADTFKNTPYSSFTKQYEAAEKLLNYHDLIKEYVDMFKIDFDTLSTKLTKLLVTKNQYTPVYHSLREPEINVPKLEMDLKTTLSYFSTRYTIVNNNINSVVDVFANILADGFLTKCITYNKSLDISKLKEIHDLCFTGLSYLSKSKDLIEKCSQI